MIIGIDEVGRGCWAGPVVAAAVELPAVHVLDKLTDSKKLSAKVRRELMAQVQDVAVQYAIGWVWPREINKIGLTESVRLAMQRAVDQLKLDGQEIIIDGNYNFLPHLNGTSTIVRADSSVPAVSAASIIAKVARDHYMGEVGLKYPQYGFEKHVGYGTAQHINALNQYGVIKTLHRLTYKPIVKFAQ